MTSPSPLDARTSLARTRQVAAAAIRKCIRLPPRLTLSAWADRYRVLSPESSAEPGPWRTERVPYLREIMDTISGRDYQDVTVVKSSQTAGTEALNNAVGYYIDQEPSPILVVQPNVKPMAEAWSKDRLAPMLRDSPRLKGKVKDPRARDSGNTVLHKVFPGGYITAIGANSAAGLASRPIRVVLADELDRWGKSAGTEGDPLALAEARTITFRHRKKVVKISTPGNEGESRIEREWAASDQRTFHVPCPQCGHYQPLEWRTTENGPPGIVAGRGAYRLVWEKESDGDGDAVIHHPETAVYQCRSCEQLIPESAKPAMLAAGRWVKGNPSATRAGFHVSGLLSPWVRWSELATEWLRVRHEPEGRKTFINTKLGLLYVESGEMPDATTLEARAERYAAEVPAGVAVLTAGIDVQADRLELQVTGWGYREESWMIRLERIYGDPEGDEVWARAEALLAQPWRHESGAALRVACCMVDSGYATNAVYAFVRPRQLNGVFAAKGNDDAKVPLSRASRANRDHVKVFTYAPSKFKDTLFARLKKQVPGAGYYHFGTREQTGADPAYFQQFGAERRAVHYERGRFVVTYANPARKRNESIDLSVLTLIALRAMGMGVTEHLKQIHAKLVARGQAQTEAATDAAAQAAEAEQRGADASDAPVEASAAAAAEAPRAPAKPRRARNWVNRWR